MSLQQNPCAPLNSYGVVPFQIGIKPINLNVISNQVRVEHLLPSIYFDRGCDCFIRENKNSFIDRHKLIVGHSCNPTIFGGIAG